jgi:hypothetical protein
MDVTFLEYDAAEKPEDDQPKGVYSSEDEHLWDGWSKPTNPAGHQSLWSAPQGCSACATGSSMRHSDR